MTKNQKKKSKRQIIHVTNIRHGAPFFRNCTVQVIAREVTVIEGGRERVCHTK